ncbi:MAG TPA: hypothetical protein VHB45_14985 [Alloacidobacterium sp.]|nr:hypothetical protein [Alloacidobacterium sp.]
MRKLSLGVMLLFLSASLLSFAQDTSKPAKTPGHFYKLAYVVQEVSDSGKVINTRSYMTNIRIGEDGVQIRAGNRVPIDTEQHAGAVSSSLVNLQFQYRDVGINIDSAHAEEIEEKLALKVTAEENDFAGPSSTWPNQITTVPVIRQNKWSGDFILPIGKPTVIFSSDDLSTRGKIQIVLTPTRVD